jgi:predicted small lipoprotein YifL
MNVRRGRGVAALAVVVALTGCGSKASPTAPPAGPSGAGQAATTNAAPQQKGGPSGTLKLTGFYTFDGPFTGQFDCNAYKGTFELEGQEPYLIDILVHDFHDGTFTVNPQNPNTGFSPRDPGQPDIDVRRLDPSTTSDDPTFRQNGGTLTFVDGGRTGTLIADYIDDEHPNQKVHVELHWKDCIT